MATIKGKPIPYPGFHIYQLRNELINAKTEQEIRAVCVGLDEIWQQCLAIGSKHETLEAANADLWARTANTITPLQCEGIGTHGK